MTTARTQHNQVSKFSPPRGGHASRLASPRDENYIPTAVDADGNLVGGATDPDNAGTFEEREAVGTPSEGDDGFDPGEHNIEDVKAYVAANPEYATEVLELERDGKDRTTLVEWLESHQTTENDGE